MGGTISAPPIRPPRLIPIRRFASSAHQHTAVRHLDGENVSTASALFQQRVLERFRRVRSSAIANLLQRTSRNRHCMPNRHCTGCTHKIHSARFREYRPEWKINRRNKLWRVDIPAFPLLLLMEEVTPSYRRGAFARKCDMSSAPFGWINVAGIIARQLVTSSRTNSALIFSGGRPCQSSFRIWWRRKTSLRYALSYPYSRGWRVITFRVCDDTYGERSARFG